MSSQQFLLRILNVIINLREDAKAVALEAAKEKKKAATERRTAGGAGTSGGEYKQYLIGSSIFMLLPFLYQIHRWICLV